MSNVQKKEVPVERKPLIRKNVVTGEMVAGFLNVTTGVFETVREINDERDIDQFLDDYDLSVVLVSKV